ncbi:amidase domain-containing protein [Desulfosporosinus nitroreducens]|uniref:Amidase domain-containing protein n=1 Tax=Desulfosporosinus nitroreducens TaxID=2018668 RepID=A0ABT8QZK0_9FIRM|nr:amidase domain-containing protein [Desulfosporosinus nitroreducens]MDO0826065.1 amidase domain-containing protein [Desulfosporosinus nitroreducens]
MFNLINRRTKLITLILILMLSIIPSYASASEKMDYVTFAKNIIEMDSKNSDLGTNFDLSKAVTPELASFLKNRADIRQYSIKLNNNYVTNYNVIVNLIENKTVQNKVYLKFQVAKSFNYIDLPDVNSGEGTIVEMLIDSKSNKVIDMYSPGNYFDNLIRGVNLDILNDSNRIGSTQIKAAEAKCTELKDSIRDEYILENIKVPEPDVSTTPSIITRATRYNLNGNNISAYARNNYNKQKPASGNGSVPYYDFSLISGNWDCTNFVSHALLAGGATVYDTGKSGISGTGWYYRDMNNRSSSWSGVINLYDFVTTNTTKGPGGTSAIYSTSPGSNRIGDIIQFHNGSVWIHSTVVTGTYPLDDRVGALVTGRSANGHYNDNTKASDVYPGYAKRILYLYNYK